ncbi:hypothetical protein Bbelb_316140 [Branchiostoma belcheri]|nr:hypothetical protein Bbelb_316140 [Branchiostoma belcheri]
MLNGRATVSVGDCQADNSGSIPGCDLLAPFGFYRWRVLTKRMDVSLDRVPTIVGACCVLHNVCEVHRDDYDIPIPEERRRPAAQRPGVRNAARDAGDLRRPAAQRPGVPNAARDALTRLFAAEG